MVDTVFELLAAHPFVAILLVLAFGCLVGRIELGSFSMGSTAGSVLCGLAIGALAFQISGIRFDIPPLVGTIFLALSVYAIGLRVGPQFVEGLRREGAKLLVLVIVTTTCTFAIAHGGALAFDLEPGFAVGILSGASTNNAVMGIATAAIEDGLYVPPAGLETADVNANIAAGYSLTYVFSIVAMVLLVRSLPALFGIDPVAAAKEAERKYGGAKSAVPGTTAAFEVGVLHDADIRVFELASARFVGRQVREVFESLGTPVLRITRGDTVIPLVGNPRLQKGDLLSVGGKIENLVDTASKLGPEVANEAARRFDIDLAEIVLTRKEFAGKTFEELRESPPAYGVGIRAIFRGGHELPLLPAMPLARSDVLRVIGPRQAVARLTAALGIATRATNTTDVITLGIGLATGYLFGLVTVPIAGVPIGLGTMGGIVIAGIVISVLRSINPALGGPMPEGARAFLETIGIDVFVATLGLTGAPFLVTTLTESNVALIVIPLGIVCATLPTLISWVIGLYLLKMDPIVLAGAVAGARNSTAAMVAISREARSTMPSYGYPVPYALSTVVFLIYGYVTMLLS